MIPTKALYKVLTQFIPNVMETYKTDYATRLKVQKIIYLIEEFRGKDSYGFSWYLAGPYSSVLTHQMYNTLIDEDKDTIEEWNNLIFSDKISNVLSSVSEFIKKAQKIEHMNDDKLYEFLASVWYIKDHLLEDEENNQFENIKNKLITNKPHFSDLKKINDLIELVISQYSQVA